MSMARAGRRLGKARVRDTIAEMRARRFVWPVAGLAGALAASCQLVDPPGDLTSGGAATTDGSLPTDGNPTGDTSPGGDGGPPPSDASDGATGCSSANLDADPGNCGFCGHQCGAVPCNAGLCASTLTVGVDCDALDARGGILYTVGPFSSADAGVYSVDPSSAKVTTLVTGVQTPYSGRTRVAASSSYVFWLEGDAMGSLAVSLHRAQLDGSNPSLLFTVLMGDQITCLAANTDTVYWSSGSSVNKLAAAAAPGTMPTVVYTGDVRCVAANDQWIGFTEFQAAFQIEISSGKKRQLFPSKGTVDEAVIGVGDGVYFVTDNMGPPDKSLYYAHTTTDTPALVASWVTASTNVTDIYSDGVAVFISRLNDAEVDECTDPTCSTGLHPIYRDPKGYPRYARPVGKNVYLTNNGAEIDSVPR